MKFLANILLLFFLSFQFAPTIITLVDKENESKISWLVLDEEETENSKETKEIKDLKEYKTEFLSVNVFSDVVIFKKSQIFTTDTYLLKDYLADLSLHATPPELV